MSFLQGKCLFVLAITCMAAAPSVAFAQRGGKAELLPDFEPSPEVLQLHPDIWDYRFDARQFRGLYAADVSSMAVGMYNLSGKQAERVRSLAEKMSEKRTKEDAVVDSWMDRRAQHFNRLLSTASRTGADLNDMILKDRSLSKYTDMIEASKPADQFDFEKVQAMVEQELDDNSTVQARESWRSNLEKLGVKVSLHGVALEAAAAGGIKDEAFFQTLAKHRISRPQSVVLNAAGKGKSTEKPVERMKEVKPGAKGAAKPIAGKRPQASKPAARSKAAGEKEESRAKRAAHRPKRSSESRRKTPKAKQSSTQSQVPNAPPLSEWEKFVRDFIEEHKLSEAQTHSALGILEEQQSRARAVQARQANQRKRADEIKDRRQKAEKLAELDRPINRLFSNLKTRLDQLLTTQQRADARNKAGASRKGSRKK